MKQRPLSIFFAAIVLTAYLATIGWMPENTSCAAQASSPPNNMPVVFVDPPNVRANVGEVFTVSVRIFNLTNNDYIAAHVWTPGEDLPYPGILFNYSLGNLYGLDVLFSWDPEVLDYVGHQKKIPMEEYADGILHEPTLEIRDVVDAEKGTYWIAESSLNPASVFNKPADNATVFDMTFQVKKQGISQLMLEEVQLAVPIYLPGYRNFSQECPHWVIDGLFETPTLATRLDTLEVGTLILDELCEPLISGEPAIVRVNVMNDASVADVFNLSIVKNTIQLNMWMNIAIEAGERIAFSHLIKAIDLDEGFHVVTATVTSNLLKVIGVDFDNATSTFRVVGTPALNIQGSTSAALGSYPRFDASASVHSDPKGQIQNYIWTLYAPGETVPRDQATGGSELITYTFHIKDTWPTGHWIVVLNVIDNFGLRYSENRPASAPYQKMRLLTVGPMHLNITNISQDPVGEIILPNIRVRITATVEALNEVRFVKLKYAVMNSTGTYIENLYMMNPFGDTWIVTIPPFPQDTEIIYTITAEDWLGNSITTEELGYQLGYDVLPEFSYFIILLALMITTLATFLVCQRKRSQKLKGLLRSNFLN